MLKPKTNKKDERIRLWAQVEARLASSLNPEDLRTSGLISTELGNWNSALLRLEEAVQHGIRDSQTLDALGEAVCQTRQYSLLLPFADFYREPRLAIHLARVLWFLGDAKQAHEYCLVAEPTLLQEALLRMTSLPPTIEDAIDHILMPFATNREPLNFPDYWQLVGPLAEVAERKDLMAQAERRLKALVYEKPTIHFNQALRLLNEQQFTAAWKMYEFRLWPGSPCEQPLSCGGLVMWEGESLAKDDVLLIVLENGLGDQVFALRFVREWLSKNEGRVEIAAHAALFELIQESFPQLRVHRHVDAFDSQYWDHQEKSGLKIPRSFCYAFSLPARNCWSGTIQTQGFLGISEARMENARKVILGRNVQNLPNLPVRSITWHGDIRTAPMRTRAYTVQEFAEQTNVFRSPCLLLVLQKDITAEELTWLLSEAKQTGSTILDLSSQMKDLAQTAAWLSQSDEVYSCDTAVAHLAGALARPTTVLIRNTSIWHWKERRDGFSVWNSSVKVKRALNPKYSYMFELHPQGN